VWEGLGACMSWRVGCSQQRVETGCDDQMAGHVWVVSTCLQGFPACCMWRHLMKLAVPSSSKTDMC
jgi:hypothetical protein